MAKKKIIIYSEINWDFLDQRHHQIARFFANKGHRVIFVQRVISRIPSYLEIFRLIKRKITTSNKSAYEKSVPRNILLRTSRFLPSTNKLFNIWNYFHWKISWEKIQNESIVYSFVDNPYLIGNQKDCNFLDRISIFDVIHNWWEYPWNTNIHKLNASQCCLIYSKIFTDSERTLEKIRSIRGASNTYLIMPGVSNDWFVKRENFNIPKSKLVKFIFFGNLRSNSDIELLKSILKNNAFSLTIVGLIDKTISFNSNKIQYYKPMNPKNIAEICNDHHIAILPYKNDEFSSTISPAKYFECLASGCLVISRSNLSHLPGWETYVLNINNLDSIEELIRSGLDKQKNIFSKQIEFASDFKWEMQLNNLWNYINE